MPISPAEARALLKEFDANFDGAVLLGMTNGLKIAQKVAVTDFMEGGGSDTTKNPPNPPPGPIKVRSGDLRRSVVIIKPAVTKRGYWVGGLGAGDKKVRYARIHELGGSTGRARIEARPYLGPAMEASIDAMHTEVDIAISQLVARYF